MNLPAIRALTLLIAFFLSLYLVYAQNGVQISGLIVDSVNNEPIDFASVSLLNQQSNQAIKGGQTDEAGKFVFTGIPAGT